MPGKPVPSKPYVPPSFYDANGMDWKDGACFGRERQSPINFDDHLKDPPTETLQYHYEPLQNVRLQMRAMKGLIYIDTSYLKIGSVSFNGFEYPLVRIDFHVGSEHLIKGKRFSMEIQLVHRRIDDPMKQLVIGIPVWSAHMPKPKDVPLHLFSRRPVGPYYPPLMTDIDHNSIIQSFLTVRPPHIEGQIVDLVIPMVKPLDLSALLENPLYPGSGTFIQYSGSLTTPPCSDSTTWFVRRKPLIASNEQMQAFGNSIFRLTNKHGNFRAVMPVNQRQLAVFELKWVPYYAEKRKPLPLGPNARTDGEHQAAKVALHARELSDEATEYIDEFRDRWNVTRFLSRSFPKDKAN
jgi:carbonic anhydrase